MSPMTKKTPHVRQEKQSERTYAALIIIKIIIIIITIIIIIITIIEMFLVHI